MRRHKLLKKPEHNHQTKAFTFSETQEKLDTRMSCCGGNCGCGAGCKCGAGCNGCGMYPDVEATAAAATVVLVAATHKGPSRSSGGLETAAEENGGCDCSTCKCGTSCGCSCCSCN